MTDDSFPTAILPARAKGHVPLAERFDALARRIGDPLTTLFLSLQATRVVTVSEGQAVEVPDQEMRFRAAAELMPYRYPKLKASEVHFTGQGGGPTVNIQINVEAPTQVSAVTPAVDPLG